MGVVETFGDTDNRGETAGDALVIAVQGRVSGMMAGGFGLAIVVAHDGANDVAIAPFEARDVAVERQVFAVLVVAPVADAMANVMEKGAGLKLHAGLGWQVVNGLKLIKEHEAEFANVFGVALVVFEASAVGAGANEDLARLVVVAMRFFAGEGFACNFLQQAFANADTGDEKALNVEVTAER